MPFLGDGGRKKPLHNRLTVRTESSVRGDLSLPCVAAPSSRPQCEGRPDSQRPDCHSPYLVWAKSHMHHPSLPAASFAHRSTH